MKLKEFFLKQLAYNDAMNKTMLGKLKELEHPPLECLKLLSHITLAQILWLERMYGTPLIKTTWDTLDIPAIEDKLRDNHQGWIAFMNEVDEDGLNKIYSYTSTRGEPFENSLYDILFHVINHSTHHRAQISKILRQHDIAPPVMDYINYVREH